MRANHLTSLTRFLSDTLEKSELEKRLRDKLWLGGVESELLVACVG